MTFQTWCLFCLTVIILSGTPGPNMFHVMSRSIAYGPRRALYAMLGSITALTLTLAIAAAGVGAILLASPGIFTTMQYAGIAYLCYLGIQAWRGSDAPFILHATSKERTNLILFRDGFLVCASNPKLILFAAAFFPQFVDQSQARLPQFTTLICSYMVIEFSWYLFYGFGGTRIARLLTRPSMQIWFNRFVSCAYAGFALTLLLIQV